MPCKYNNTCGKLCSHFAVTTAVAFTDGILVYTLPDNKTYSNGEKFCIVFGQAVPDETTRNAPVVFVVGTGTTQFPLLTRCGTPVTQGQIDTRRIYPTRVMTSAASGSLVALCDLGYSSATPFASLNDIVAAEGGA